MISIERILKVPQESEIRKKLRENARLYVRKEKILPPSDLITLEKHAKTLLTTVGISNEYVDFVIVLLGNEIWRDTVIATPFIRRLLILPQCIKNKEKCKAVVDEFGLICAACKSCRIDEILNKAEDLGYSTLVAEGTTVAIGLVEEGSIDAVIGVSCMPVLQKSFEPVTRAAVPAIGLPLLNDGCENTLLDYHWFFEELIQYNDDYSARPLSVFLLKKQIEAYFSEQSLLYYFPVKNETEKIALKFMSMGGQRMRPLLSVLAYQSYSMTLSETIQKELSVIIECFHKASLIHDDIEDDEDFRYGNPAIHKSEGIPIAINTGDYLIGKGYQLLANLPLDGAVISECLKVISSSHIKLTEGQGADILLHEKISEHSVDEVINIFKNKTGEAVKVALLTGAICGNAAKYEIELLSEFSEVFGIAYQIRDDLNEYDEKNSNEHAFDFPFLLSLLNEGLKDSEHSFQAILKMKDVDTVRLFLFDYGIEVKAREYMEYYLSKCFNILDKLQNQKLRLSLYGVMGKIFKS